MTSNGFALISGGALAAAAMLFRLISEMVAGFPQGGGHAIGRLIGAGMIFLVIGYALTRAVLWAIYKTQSIRISRFPVIETCWQPAPERPDMSDEIPPRLGQ